MRFRSAFSLMTLLVMASVIVASAADAAPMPAPHRVEIPTGGSVLHAQLYKPEGDGPFPVVIALHGCGGLAGIPSQSSPVTGIGRSNS
jgi:poly(3-hydroxybutyrate) depolymerase